MEEKKLDYIFIDADFNVDTLVSTATIERKGKQYTATVKRAKDDKTPVSSYQGCYFAELKAYLKALRAEYQEAKAEYHKYENFVKSLICYKDFDKNSPTAKVVFRQLNRRKKNVINAYAAWRASKDGYLTVISQWEILTGAIARRKAQRTAAEDKNS